jgi:hypothetical protein
MGLFEKIKENAKDIGDQALEEVKAAGDAAGDLVSQPQLATEPVDAGQDSEPYGAEGDYEGPTEAELEEYDVSEE